MKQTVVNSKHQGKRVHGVATIFLWGDMRKGGDEAMVRQFHIVATRGPINTAQLGC